MRPLIVLAYTSIEHNVETWACSVSKSGRNPEAQSLCKELRAARILLIPLLILGVVILAITVWSRFGTSKRQGVSSDDALGSEQSKHAAEDV